MKTHELKIELSKRLADVNARIIALKERHDQMTEENAGPRQTEESATLQEVILELEGIRDNILTQFNEIERLEESEHHRMPELERNIYKSFGSFEESFSKAGSLSRSTRFRQRDRNIDFKDPMDTR